jgi:Fur family ferric uptake transcriptional regulator
MLSWKAHQNEARMDELRSEVRRRLEDFLENGGHRRTPERFAVLDMIYAHGGHFDIDRLMAWLAESGRKVSRATLYNTIELLMEAGLVRKHQFEEGNSQFEPGYPARQHDHIILDNGEVLEFCDPRIHQIKRTLEEHFGIEVLHHALHIYARRKPSKK